MDKIKEILTRARASWDKLDKKKKVLMIFCIIAIVLVVSIFTIFINKVNYALLFRDLQLHDAGIIVDDLKSKGIKHRLENSGRDIYIDKNKIDEYRLQLAMQDMLPETSTGFEIFDDTGMMVTEEDRRIMYQRALTGELEKSISSLDVIESAKVHLVLPERSIFETEDKAATASVVIKLKPMQNVTPNMVNGIVSLVSGAVDNLPKENIQVVDTQGNLLSGFINESGSLSTVDLVNQHQKIRDDFEKKIESNIMQLLGSSYGWDKIKVSVMADLDFDSEETTTITYSNVVPRSEQIEVTGDDIDIQQVTGGIIDDNISNVVDSVQGTGSSYKKIINNEVSSKTSNTIQAPGKVNKLTASVVYKGGLSDIDLMKIENIVAAAIGYDYERGDIINVEAVNLEGLIEDTDSVIDPEAAEKDEEKLEKYLPYLLAIIAFLVLILTAMLLVRRSRKKKAGRQQIQDKSAIGNTVEDIYTEMVELDFQKEIKADKKGDMAKKYAQENPDIAADLIRAWMKEDQG